MASHLLIMDKLCILRVQYLWHLVTICHLIYLVATKHLQVLFEYVDTVWQLHKMHRQKYAMPYVLEIACY